HHFGTDAVSGEDGDVERVIGRHEECPWSFDRSGFSGLSWPGLTRPSTSFLLLHPKTWMPGTRPGMTAAFVLRRQYSSADQASLLQTAECVESLGERHRRHRDRRDLFGAHELEQFLGFAQIADIAALNRDRLDRDQRQGES